MLCVHCRPIVRTTMRFRARASPQFATASFWQEEKEREKNRLEPVRKNSSTSTASTRSSSSITRSRALSARPSLGVSTVASGAADTPVRSNPHMPSDAVSADGLVRTPPQLSALSAFDNAAAVLCRDVGALELFDDWREDDRRALSSLNPAAQHALAGARRDSRVRQQLYERAPRRSEARGSQAQAVPFHTMTPKEAAELERLRGRMHMLQDGSGAAFADGPDVHNENASSPVNDAYAAMENSASVDYAIASAQPADGKGGVRLSPTQRISRLPRSAVADAQAPSLAERLPLHRAGAASARPEGGLSGTREDSGAPAADSCSPETITCPDCGVRVEKDRFVWHWRTHEAVSRRSSAKADVASSALLRSAIGGLGTPAVGGTSGGSLPPRIAAPSPASLQTLARPGANGAGPTPAAASSIRESALAAYTARAGACADAGWPQQQSTKQGAEDTCAPCPVCKLRIPHRQMLAHWQIHVNAPQSSNLRSTVQPKLFAPPRHAPSA